ncbi:MAG: hypothetical protein JO323_14570 [Acidobacteriia bacterium]|nr:hypothetical protein [Terriglobia bacterium]
MSFMDWIKSPERAYKADPSIKSIWKGGPYADQGSGYTVQACLGMSDKGYHGGLHFTSPKGEEKTTWHRPVQRRDHAMEESYKAFHGWVKSHEAQLDRKQPRDIKRTAASWERGR